MADKVKKTKDAALSSLLVLLGAAGGATVNELTDTNIIDAEYVVQIQEDNKLLKKDFEQILKSGEKPDDAEDKTKVKDFPDDMRVDVYDGPKGAGYTIVQTVGNKEIHLSFGPESEQRSFIINNEVIATTSSSTNIIKTP